MSEKGSSAALREEAWVSYAAGPGACQGYFCAASLSHMPYLRSLVLGFFFMTNKYNFIIYVNVTLSYNFITISFMMKVKEESEKVGLKPNIQKTKIMASSPITSWQIYEETVRDFIFLSSKITADGYCSHEIKRRLFLGWKAMTNLDSIV